MNPESGATRRRRGEALEAAILDAAWEILETAGLSGFTFEAIAARAGTSRPVLSRRWARRDDLLLAAIERQWTRAPIEVPDTGALRDDAVELLRRADTARAPLMTMMAAQLGSYFHESGTSIDTIRTMIRPPGSPNGCAQIVARAVSRGEIPDVPRSRRVIDLPFDLLRHDMLVTRQPDTDDALVEIVDDIWLPLLQRAEC